LNPPPVSAHIARMETAIVVHPVLPGSGQPEASRRTPDGALEEAVGLAEAINLNVVHREVIPVLRPRPSTLFGSGKLDDLTALMDGLSPRPDLVIVDGVLSAVQHRNLEKALAAKVLDRTALILEIFGARAQTAEGRLQVDLAHLTYQRSRLVRSWTHLERQRGGAGFLGGPGERQIESDRRALADKIVRLNRKLDEVRRTRTLQRAKRKRAPQPVIALVGYTNAGKSTLFNRLTEATVKAEDLLFATLDPTMRAVDLPSGQRVIFSDTVGFVSELPTQLVAAFRATLEEVLEADLILHVRDIAHPETDAQKADVLGVLHSLGLPAQGDGDVPSMPGFSVPAASADHDDVAVIEVWSKIDQLDEDERFAKIAAARLSHGVAEGSFDDPVKTAVSALTGEGTDRLLAEIDRLLTVDRRLYRCALPVWAGRARAFLYRTGDVVREEAGDDTLYLSVRLSAKTAGQFREEFGLALETNDAADSGLRRTAG